MTESPRRADLLIVGSGLMGAAVAQLVSEAAPWARIVMVDGGRVIGSVPGQHLHDMPDDDVRNLYLQRASPGIQSLYMGADVTPAIGGSVRGIQPGMYNLSAFASSADDMPASAVAWNAGGMGVHWTAATPWPWGSEIFDEGDRETWADQLDAARRLLRVHQSPFGTTRAGRRMLEMLDDVYGPVSAEGRHPQPMPMAVTPTGTGPMPRTGPNRIFPRMIHPSGDDFDLRTGTLATTLLHDGDEVRGARVRHVDTDEEYEIEASVTVVAADTIRTPQLLYASGIRPAALGRYLNEHAFLTGQVIADHDRLGVPLRDIPLHKDGEWVLGSYWLPHSGSAQPFHGQIMDRVFIDEAGERLAYSVGLSLYVPTEIRESNRLEFSDDALDSAGMPQISLRFRYTDQDLGLIDEARESQRLAAGALGDFDPERDSALLPAGSSLHFTGTARSGPTDDGTSVCDPTGRVWGFSNLYLAGGAVIPTAVVANSTLTGMVTAVRAGRAIAGALRPARISAT